MNLSEERLILVMKKALEESRYNFIHFFLPNSEGAKAMHKAVLEHQLFFYSPKVRKSVVNHYLLSMPCWALPAKWFTKIPSKELYHLDVKLTRRHSYDQHYGAIIQDSNKTSTYTKHEWLPKCAKCKVKESNTIFCPCGHVLFCSDCAVDEVFCQVCDETVTACQKAYFAMDTEDNDWTCQICMDDVVNTVFCPCGHVYCCEECASNLTYCPLCKTFATYVQRVHVEFPKDACESPA